MCALPHSVYSLCEITDNIHVMYILLLIYQYFGGEYRYYLIANVTEIELETGLMWHFTLGENGCNILPVVSFTAVSL